ncbi:hypothetical protein HanRHA438_Chr16g0741721 [Helianthus annuus]|nr:hypothetical protein HanRHA438_Chr16g0741721 [Helianthus annuus]
MIVIRLIACEGTRTEQLVRDLESFKLKPSLKAPQMSTLFFSMKR